MIFVRNRSLPQDVQTYLDRKQNEIDSLTQYQEQVEKAKSYWESKDKNKFATIRAELANMTLLGRRCHYCEDSMADEVEHVFPKTFYPEKSFQWGNYLFACGPCNGTWKKDQFAVWTQDNQSILFHRTKGDYCQPPDGEPAFIHPRLEDPLQYLKIDLINFLFHPYSNSPRECDKAKRTIEILNLNRAELVEMRRWAYESFLNNLEVYIARKKRNENDEKLIKRKEDIWVAPHVSVWREMVRNCNNDKLGLKKLFDQVPELLVEPVIK